MTRALVLSLLLAGCANAGALGSGSTDGPPGGTTDAPRNGRDAIIIVDDAPAGHDGPVVTDGPVAIDAPHVAIDAPTTPIDAPPPPIDAPHIDAAPPPPDACVPINTQLLANATFDADPAGQSWTENEPADDFELIGAYANPVQSAPYCVFVGGEVGYGSITDTLTQSVTIPANTTQLVLTGYYAVPYTEETGSHAYDTSQVLLTKSNGSTIETVLSVSNTDEVTAWTPFSHAFNVSGLSGTTVRVRVTSTVDDTDETDFLYDSFSLVATHGCP